MELEKIIRKYALQNAVLHDGKAQAGAVVGKLIAEKPEIKDKIQDLIKQIQKIAADVNKLKIDSQRKELEQMAPELLEKKEVGEKELPPLPGAVMGKVVVRYPPEPSGYMHLGHAYSFFLNRLYADKYKGKVWLRFEDTNPEKIELEYFDAFKDGLKWLGLKWDFEKKLSDDMLIFYKHAEQLLKSGDLYACTCSQEEIKDNRAKGENCKCRKRTSDENLKLWKEMLKDLPEGKAIIRLKGEMESPNMDLRDPIMFRINVYPHPVQGTKFRVWPTYDFAGSIEDSICGITHVLRSAEFEQRAILQSKIRSLLGMKEPVMIHYARVALEGALTSKREVRGLIEKGVIQSWDDPRLATITALRRRGILPETFKELAILIGPTKSEHSIEIKMLLSINRKLLDPIASRYFLVKEPVKLEVKTAPPLTAELHLHPQYKERGVRKLKTNGQFFIDKSDVSSLKPGAEVRLKDLYNIKITKVSNDKVLAEFVGKEMRSELPKLHWVPLESVEAKLVVPGQLFVGDEINPDSLKTYACRAETGVKELKVGEHIQLERIGFAIIDKKDPLTLILTSD